MRMSIEPEDHVRVPVQQRQHLSAAEQWLTVGSRMPGQRMNEAFDTMMREDHHKAIVGRGPHRTPGDVDVVRVHLGEPCFEPTGLIMIKAAGCSAGKAVCVQRDEPDLASVVDVVGGTIDAISLRETMAMRPRRRLEMGFHELLSRHRSARGIGRDPHGRSGHEYLGSVRKELEGTVVVEVVGQRPGLDLTDHCGSDLGAYRPDTLIQCLVIAKAR